MLGHSSIELCTEGLQLVVTECRLYVDMREGRVYAQLSVGTGANDFSNGFAESGIDLRARSHENNLGSNIAVVEGIEVAQNLEKYSVSIRKLI